MGAYGHTITPPRHSSLFVSALGRSTRMHMDNLEGSLDAPVFNPRRPVVGQMSFGAGQPEYGGQVTLFVLKFHQN